MPTTGVATQVAHPARATVRTVIQVALSILLVLGPTLAIGWGIVTDELGKQGITLPPTVLAVVAVIIGLLVAVAAIVARLMQIPVINLLLARFNLSALPPGAEPDDPAPLAAAAREADGQVAKHAATPIDPD